MIRTDAPFRWRARYNEDFDLSLRMLKANWCTILFVAFLQDKTTTMTMAGGNTDTLYVNGTLDKSKMIVNLHPDVCRLAMRYGRVHHYVDYSHFKSRALIRKEALDITSNVNEYGMKLIQNANL